VRALFEAEPARIGAIFQRIGAITRAARAAIETEPTGRSTSNTIVTTLGSLMDENHALLRDLTVSSEKLDRLCAAAREAGAAGAKLSGGGRGGNLIAPVTPKNADRVAAALRDAGAMNVIKTEVQ
jgi:mevalonate kinase